MKLLALFKNRYKWIIALAVYTLLPFGIKAAEGPDMDAFVGQFAPADLVLERSLIDHLTNFVATPQSIGAGEEGELLIEFDIKHSEFVHTNLGGYTFAFPENFSLDINSIELTENHPVFDQTVKNFRVSDQTLIIELSCLDNSGSGSDDHTYDHPVHVSLLINSIHLPEQSGEFRIAGAVYDKKNRLIVGPDLSDPFTIEPGEPTVLTVDPSETIIIKAGESIVLNSYLSDVFGNIISEQSVEWIFVEGDEQYGELISNFFLAQHPGIVQFEASFNELTARTGLITIVTGDLALIELEISSDQLVEMPLVGIAKASLFDSFQNPVTSIDLEATPLELYASIGGFQPSMIADQSLMDGNVINFIPALVSYEGNIGTVNVNAAIKQTKSNSLVITFADKIAPVLQYQSGSLYPRVTYAGVTNQCKYEVYLADQYPDGLIMLNGSFSVAGDGFSVTVPLVAPEDSIINSGTTVVKSELFFVPQNLENKSLTFSSELTYFDPARGEEIVYHFETDFDGITIIVEDVKTVQIISLNAISMNAPFVNVGQAFKLVGLIASHSSTAIRDLDLRLSSSNGSVFNPRINITEIAPFDTVEITFDVVAASSPTSSELFHLDFNAPGLNILDPVDNSENIVIQTSADLDLSYDLFGVTNGMVAFGAEFSMAVEVANSGEADVSNAMFLLSTSNFAIGGNFPDSGEIIIGEHLVFNFIAPAVDSPITIRFELTSLPIGKNTGLPALINRSEFEFVIQPEAFEGDLHISAESSGNTLITPSVKKDIISVLLVNKTADGESVLAIDSLVFSLFDDAFNSIPVISIQELDRTNLIVNGVEYSEEVISGNHLIYHFNDLNINPGDSVVAILQSTISSRRYDVIIYRAELDQTGAVYVDGPLTGGRPIIIADGGAKFDVRLVVRETNFENSVVVQQNPFNPEFDPLRFSYMLSIHSDVEFSIYTLTGELVYSRFIAAGSEGAVVGSDNILEWDGRNGEGRSVLNGVYIISVQINATGEHSRKKVALVK